MTYTEDEMKRAVENTIKIVRFEERNRIINSELMKDEDETDFFGDIMLGAVQQNEFKAMLRELIKGE